MDEYETDEGRRALMQRAVVLGVGAAASAVFPAEADVPAQTGADPDLGPNVVIISPDMPAADIQAKLDAIHSVQQTAHFTDRRDAVLFKPGRYAVEAKVGFFTQIAGLGRLPGDVLIDGHVQVDAQWFKGNALVNFWRAVENLAVRPPDGADRWAVSQAAPYRRIHLMGDLRLDDGGSSSGGFMADCQVEGVIRSGSQQQWYTRGATIGGWDGANWNMMFQGVIGAPPTTFPRPPVTTLSAAPIIREKPHLQVDAAGQWGVFVPALRHDADGTSWSSGEPGGTFIPLSRFFIAQPGVSAHEINMALSQGRHLLLTPGVYALDAPIRVERANTVVLGLGLATLLPVSGDAALIVADAPGVSIAGLLIDAGPMESSVLMTVGPRGAAGDHAANPTLLADLFFRVGGVAVGKAGTCLEINSHHVIGDHLWIWRADHGDLDGGRKHVGWAESPGDQGLIVRGDDVTVYGLFVEHFRRHQTIWEGERGRTFFYQSELPYDPPSQSVYRADGLGWAAYKVADGVERHEAVGLGVYAFFNVDPSIVVESAVEAPRRPGVRFTSVTTISLGGGVGSITHLVNDQGAAARPGAIHQVLARYP